MTRWIVWVVSVLSLLFIAAKLILRDVARTDRWKEEGKAIGLDNLRLLKNEWKTEKEKGKTKLGFISWLNQKRLKEG